MEIAEVIGWFRKKRAAFAPAPSQVARDVAAAFRSGPIKKSNIDAQGLSNMAIAFRGSVVVASWYSSGRLCYVSVDGTSSFGSTVDAEHIKDAAIARAEMLLDETLQKLSDKYE